MNQITLKGYITKLSTDAEKVRFGLAYSMRKTSVSEEQTNVSFETCYIQTTVFNKFLVKKFVDNILKNGSKVIVHGKLAGYKNQQGHYVNTIAATDIILIKASSIKASD